MTIHADDNWLQRLYFAWAEPHYRRMPPRTRAEVERLDRWLYSRRGAGVWAAVALAVVGSVWGLVAAGLPWPIALAASLGVLVGLPMGVLGAWLQPERFAGTKVLRFGMLLAAGLCVGSAAGFLSGRISRYGSIETSTLGPAVRSALGEVAPWLVVAVVVQVAMLQLAAFARRRLLRAELERATLVAERDAAACQAAEARLRLLQGQIRPHFIFNTLASLQHWVDTGDARAGPLLRSLTALLRTTTESMDKPLATLGAECEAARHYLDVMGARLGDRLVSRVEVETGCADVELPAGLVLTLVENAVEHGIEPLLAGGTIEVTAGRVAGDVVLSVHDDGAGLVDTVSAADCLRNGVGLANSRERLAHRYDEHATLELLPGRGGRGTEARVRIASAAAAATTTEPPP